MEDQRWDEGGPKLRDAMYGMGAKSKHGPCIRDLSCPSKPGAYRVKTWRKREWRAGGETRSRCSCRMHQHTLWQRVKRRKDRQQRGNESVKETLGDRAEGAPAGTSGDQNAGLGPGPGKGLCVDPVVDGRSDWTIWKNPVANQFLVLVFWFVSRCGTNRLPDPWTSP